jgi:hypothetical protein
MVEFVEPGGSLGACARGWRQVAQAFVEGTHVLLVGSDLCVELPETLSRARKLVAVFGKPLFERVAGASGLLPSGATF